MHFGIFFALKFCSNIRAIYDRLSAIKEMHSQAGIRYYSVRADDESNFSNCASR